jgi:hypothetical protein
MKGGSRALGLRGGQLFLDLSGSGGVCVGVGISVGVC